MCNDTEASLEADWEGYKSIWLSLNSPLLLSTNDDVSITSPPMTGIFGVISYSYASKAKVGYANAKAVA